MQPTDEGAGIRQTQQATALPEQEGLRRMAREVRAAVGAKVHGRRRTDVDLEPLLLEDCRRVRACAVAAGLVDRRTDAERALDLPA
jgi:hypothetical protein